MFDFDDLERVLSEDEGSHASDAEGLAQPRPRQPVQEHGHVRIWAISDLHTDDPKNKEWLEHIDTKDTANDVIIVAGDISHKWEIIRATLTFFKEHYGRVFYVPGNHELWGGAEEDSMQKLEKLLKLCAELHVETAPAEVATSSRRVLVVPLLSWHHPQWDTEPDIEGWQGLLPVDQMLSDYPLTHWPRGISIKDGTAAKAVDKINDRLMDWEQILARRKSFHEVLSFSHFLPRVEANPEKRYLSYPNLAKGIGSNYLRARVEALKPDVHVFGHTHFGYDLVVDGIRYVQAPLAMSSERQSRGTTVAVGDFPDGKSRPHPFLVWHSRSGWAPRCRGAAWSAYVERYGRRPDVTSLVPSYVADCGLEPISGIGGAKAKVGWLPGRMPVWFFGPRDHRIREAAAEADKVAERLRKEAAGTFKRKQRKQIGSDEPLPIEASEVAILMNKGEVAILDIREGDFASRPAGCVPLSHPSETSNFAALPDAELLELGERMMTGGGPRILVGEGSSPASCRHAALLLAALLRLWPRDVRPLRGGFDAWVKQGLPVEPTGSLGHGGY